MDFLNTTILGILEGLTEFLPVSSTGHLILASKIFNLPQSEFVKSFEIAIQLGAILSVVALYWKKFLLNSRLLGKVIVAFLPTALIGAVFYKFVKTTLFNPHVVLWALLLGGIFLVAFEVFRKGKEGTVNLAGVSYCKVAFIGLFQSLAIIPGVSRAAATILSGLGLGLDKKSAVEFSFFLAVPTMLAATGLDLIKSGGAFTAAEWKLLLLGFFVSFLAAVVGIRFLVRFISRHSLAPFGIYRVILAVAFWLLVI